MTKMPMMLKSEPKAMAVRLRARTARMMRKGMTIPRATSPYQKFLLKGPFRRLMIASYFPGGWPAKPEIIFQVVKNMMIR